MGWVVALLSPLWVSVTDFGRGFLTLVAVIQKSSENFAQGHFKYSQIKLIGVTGFEPATS